MNGLAAFDAAGNAGIRVRIHFQGIFRVDRTNMLNMNSKSLPVLKWSPLATPPSRSEKILLRFDRASQRITVGASGIETEISLHNSLRLLD